MRNCKMPKVKVGQCADYAAIHAAKKVSRRIFQTHAHLQKPVVVLRAMKL
jgi:hypothetical protein